MKPHTVKRGWAFTLPAGYVLVPGTYQRLSDGTQYMLIQATV